MWNFSIENFSINEYAELCLNANNAITRFATVIEIGTRGPSQCKDVVLSVYGSHYKDKTVSQPSYLYNGIQYMKTWDGTLGTQFAPVLYNHTTGIAMKEVTWLSYV